MAFEIYGVCPREPIGIGCRFNIFKWAQILDFASKEKIISDEDHIAMLGADNFFIADKKCIIISQLLTKSLIKLEDYEWEVIQNKKYENIVSGICKINGRDIFLLSNVLNHAGGVFIN